MEQRLQKILSAAGVLSRRKAEQAIVDGRVTVNGRVGRLGDQADPTVDHIALDGRPVAVDRPLCYLMLNKPRGVVTTMADEQGRKTVWQLVADVGARVYPVGRLDLNSEGLLILTNDGQLANALMHPRFHLDKTYRVKVRGNLDKLPQLSEPMTMEDGYVIRPARVQEISRGREEALLRLTIHEGRNRQIRQMCQQCGLEVRRLQRIAVGPLTLDRRLRAGQWRHLTEREVDSLRQACRKAGWQSKGENEGERHE